MEAKKGTSGVGQPMSKGGYRNPHDGKNEMHGYDKISKGHAGGKPKQPMGIKEGGSAVAKHEMDY